MKKALTMLLAIAMLLPCVSCGSEKEPTETTVETTTAAPGPATPGIDALTVEDKEAYQLLVSENIARAKTLGNTVEKYYINNSKGTITVLESVNARSATGSKIASVWHYTSVLSMISKLQAVNAGGQAEHYAELYSLTFESMSYYKGTGRITDYSSTRRQTMYAVDRAGSKEKADISGIKAVYDDQMWIIREMVYTYKLTGNSDYLQEALSLVKTCLDGWDTTLDQNGKEYGGICWGPGYQTKHTCSNAPIIEPLVEIYEIFMDEGRDNAEYYLDWAKKIYAWTTRLNIGNGLYGDLVGSYRTTSTEGGTTHYVTVGQDTNIDTHTYTYNTGAMISGGAALYRVTGEKQYLTQAKRSAMAAHKEMGKPEDGFVNYPTTSTNWFNLILLQGYIDLFPYDEKCKEYIDCMQRTLDHAYENYLNTRGLLPRDLVKGWDNRNTADVDKNVMDQATAAEMYAILAVLYASLGE